MNFSDTMKKIKDLEAEVTAMKEKLIEELYQHIKDKPIPGVTKISDHPQIVTVKFSALSNGLNLTPEYYISEHQANAVKDRLNGCKTASSVCNAVKEMIEKKRIQKGKGWGEYWSFYLNETTLSILRESELGKYAMEEHDDRKDTEQ